MDGSVYPNKDVIKASRSAVMLYANREKTHGMGESQVGSEKVPTCNSQFGITCDQHEALFQATSGLFFDGNIRMPTHILCNPDGSEITRKEGAMAGKEFIEFINEGVQKLGVGLGRDEYLFVKGKLADGEAALGKEDLKAAAKAGDEIKKNKVFKSQEAWLEKADELLAKVNEAGLALVKKAQEAAAAGNPDEARKLLRQVSSECSGMECAKAAKEELGKLPK